LITTAKLANVMSLVYSTHQITVNAYALMYDTH